MIMNITTTNITTTISSWEEAQDALRSAMLDPTVRTVLLLGPRGSGKTTLVRDIAVPLMASWRAWTVDMAWEVLACDHVPVSSLGRCDEKGPPARSWLIIDDLDLALASSRGLPPYLTACIQRVNPAKCAFLLIATDLASSSVLRQLCSKVVDRVVRWDSALLKMNITSTFCPNSATRGRQRASRSRQAIRAVKEEEEEYEESTTLNLVGLDYETRLQMHVALAQVSCFVVAGRASSKVAAGDVDDLERLAACMQRLLTTEDA